MTALTGLVAWYKPETLAASYANGDPIDTWADSSGNSRDLTGTTTARPLAAASAINGYMAADFDGTDDILSSASYTHSGDLIASVVFSFDIEKNYNVLAVVDGNSSPAYACDFLNQSSYSSSTSRFLAGLDDGTHRYCYRNYDVQPLTNYVVTYGCNKAVGGLISLNGQQSVDLIGSDVSAISTPSGTAYIHVGQNGIANGYLDGKICEIILYTVTDRTEVPWVEGYLADKYAITLADGHLFKNEPPQSAPTTYNTGGTGATNVAAAKFTRLE